MQTISQATIVIAMLAGVGCTAQNPSWCPEWLLECQERARLAAADGDAPTDGGTVDDLARGSDLLPEARADGAVVADLSSVSDASTPSPDLEQKPCSRVGDPCCGGIGYCDGDGVLCDGQLGARSHCLACGKAVLGGCVAGDTPAQCGEPCCDSDSCSRGSCMTTNAGVSTCIACGPQDVECSSCGGRGQTCCNGSWCRLGLGCTGPYPDGVSRCN